MPRPFLIPSSAAQEPSRPGAGLSYPHQEQKDKITETQPCQVLVTQHAGGFVAKAGSTKGKRVHIQHSCQRNRVRHKTLLPASTKGAPELFCPNSTHLHLQRAQPWLGPKSSSMQRDRDSSTVISSGLVIPRVGGNSTHMAQALGQHPTHPPPALQLTNSSFPLRCC